MSTAVHVTVATNECGQPGFDNIRDAITAALAHFAMDIDLRVDPVVFTRRTGAILPPEHSADAEKLSAISDFAQQLKASRIDGAVGLGAMMIAARLQEILKGEI